MILMVASLDCITYLLNMGIMKNRGSSCRSKNDRHSKSPSESESETRTCACGDGSTAIYPTCGDGSTACTICSVKLLTRMLSGSPAPFVTG